MSGLPLVPLVCFSSYAAGDDGGGLMYGWGCVLLLLLWWWWWWWWWWWPAGTLTLFALLSVPLWGEILPASAFKLCSISIWAFFPKYLLMSVTMYSCYMQMSLTKRVFFLRLTVIRYESMCKSLHRVDQSQSVSFFRVSILK